MDNQFKNIHQVISNYIEISEEEWTYYSSMFRVIEIKKKSTILNQGSVCRDIYFINKGLLRMYFADNDGEEKTFHFAIENTFATDYESFFTRCIVKLFHSGNGRHSSGNNVA